MTKPTLEQKIVRAIADGIKAAGARQLFRVREPSS